MSKMPEQEFECLKCGNRFKTTLLEAFCLERGCGLRRMSLVGHPLRNKKEGGWIFYEPGPQADSPLLGCFMIPILLVVGAMFLTFLYSIAKEMF